MNKSLAIFILLSLAFVCGCAGSKSSSRGLSSDEWIQKLPVYSGLKARIAVADFDLKDSRAGAQTGIRLKELLLKTLRQAHRFDIVEYRSQIANANQQPDSLKDNLAPADLVISVVITRFEPQASGGSSGVGGGGGSRSGSFGGLLANSVNKAQLALDVRILDANSSKTLAENRFQAQSLDIEEAMRICLDEVSRYICSVIGPQYYKY